MRLFPVVLGRGADFRHALLELLHERLPVLVISVLQNNGKLISADPEYRAVLKDMADQAAGSLEIDIAFFVPIPVIDPLEVVTVEYADRKSHFLAACFVHALLHLLDIAGISPLVSNGSQRVDIGPLIQIGDMILHVTRQALEGVGQPAHLVVAVIVQIIIIIALIYLLRSLGQLHERLSDPVGIEHGEYARGHQHDGGENKVISDQPFPFSLCFGDGHGDIQTHPVAQRQPRCNLFDTVIGVPDEGVLCHCVVGKDGFCLFRQLAHINFGMEEDVPIRVA